MQQEKYLQLGSFPLPGSFHLGLSLDCAIIGGSGVCLLRRTLGDDRPPGEVFCVSSRHSSLHSTVFGQMSSSGGKYRSNSQAGLACEFPGKPCENAVACFICLKVELNAETSKLVPLQKNVESR